MSLRHFWPVQHIWYSLMHIVTKYSTDCKQHIYCCSLPWLFALLLTSTKWLYLFVTARCRGPIMALLRMLGSAPSSSSNVQLSCWSCSTAQCRGVLPSLSCTFSSTQQGTLNLYVYKLVWSGLCILESTLNKRSEVSSVSKRQVQIPYTKRHE